MIEKKPDSFSDIVDRAMGELRSSPVPPELPPELLDALLQAAKEGTGAVQCAVGASAQAEIIHPTFPTHSLTNWRWIMRSSVSRIAAAAVFAFAVAGVAFWFHGGGAVPAFAEFLQPILDAKTVKFKMTMETTGTPAALAEMAGLSAERQKELMKPHTFEVMELGFNRVRQESEMPDKSKRVEIWDGRQRKQLVLYPAGKRAMLYDYSQRPDDKTTNNEDRGLASPRRRPEEPGPVVLFRSLLLDTMHKPDGQRESLGEKEIDGRRVVGFRLSVRGTVLNVWGDPKTRVPVRIEWTSALMPHYKGTTSDFEFNVPMDESLFSVDPPAGYTVIVKQRQPSDDSPAGEKDLIEMFRCYGQWCGGRFPDLLDAQWIGEVVSKAMRIDADLHHDKPQAKRDQEEEEAQHKILRGMMFVVPLPKDLDRHYAGRGVSIGAADTPVFWYRPKDAKKYRVIYADLSVQEADTPPRVPVVPVAQLEKDLTEMLRQYSELSGGLFPAKLDISPLLSLLEMKQHAFSSQDPPQKPSAKEQREMAEAPVQFHRGLMFIGLLPKGADWHYAGKGVWLGAAKRPIFWYRPQGSKTYRVIYADLSVRDADTPPSMAVVPPEQDLLNALHYYSQFFDGRFPISLNDRALLGQESFSMIAVTKIYAEFPVDAINHPSAKQMLEMTKATRNIQPGLDFVASLSPQSDWRYAGWGVSLGAAQRPVFWYRPKDSKKYRVIYADLSVHAADAAPDVPGGPPQQDLIDALRYYSELTDGTFPDSLGRKDFFQNRGKELGRDMGRRPTAKQVKECSELELKLQPGVAFAASLPPEADAHYAGKGVRRGKADTPIFWYRPKDAKKYRVIYADRTVREATTPPSVPNAQPVVSPPGPKK